MCINTSYANTLRNLPHILLQKSLPLGEALQEKILQKRCPYRDRRDLSKLKTYTDFCEKAIKSQKNTSAMKCKNILLRNFAKVLHSSTSEKKVIAHLAGSIKEIEFLMPFKEQPTPQLINLVHFKQKTDLFRLLKSQIEMLFISKEISKENSSAELHFLSNVLKEKEKEFEHAYRFLIGEMAEGLKERLQQHVNATIHSLLNAIGCPNLCGEENPEDFTNPEVLSIAIARLKEFKKSQPEFCKQFSQAIALAEKLQSLLTAPALALNTTFFNNLSITLESQAVELRNKRDHDNVHRASSLASGLSSLQQEKPDFDAIHQRICSFF